MRNLYVTELKIRKDQNMKEFLQDSLIHGLLHLAEEEGDFCIECAKELKELREENLGMETLEAFNNALWYKDETYDCLGFEVAHRIFKKFVDRYPYLTRVLTIYCYS